MSNGVVAAVYPSSLLLSLFQTQSPGSLTPFWQFLEEGMEALSHGATAKSAVSMSRDTFSGAVNGPDGDHVKRKRIHLLLYGYTEDIQGLRNNKCSVYRSKVIDGDFASPIIRPSRCRRRM